MSNPDYTELLELASDIIQDKKVLKLKVGGFSMFPYLVGGDLICVEFCSFDELRIGDILVFKSFNNWIAHRLINKNKIENKVLLVTKGDSCKYPEMPIDEKTFIGKVISFERKGRIIRFDSNHRKFINLIFAKISQWVPLFFVYYLKVNRKLKSFF